MSSSPVALITGASQGLGTAIAKQLATEGYHLVLAARNESKLTALAQSLSSQVQCLVVPTDVSSYPAVCDLVKKTMAEFGRIDVLINNAGVAPKVSLFQETSVEDIDRTIDVNVKGVMYALREVIPIMVSQQSGTIININSIAGETAFPYWAAYDASKFALRALTDAIADEQRSNNIKVVGIYPGAVDTPIWEGLELEHEPNREGMLDPETIAEAVSYILKQPAKVHIPRITLSPLKPVL